MIVNFELEEGSLRTVELVDRSERGENVLKGSRCEVLEDDVLNVY